MNDMYGGIINIVYGGCKPQLAQHLKKGDFLKLTVCIKMQCFNEQSKRMRWWQ